jgi:hypothetical protein
VEAFASDASASDVPCRHPGTVEATSGSLHRLARWSRLPQRLNHEGRGHRAYDPGNQDRADNALFRKRCCSQSGTPFVVLKTPRSVVRESMLPTRLSTRDRRATRTRSPVVIPRQLAKAASASARARPAVHAYLSMPRDQRARDASGRRLQSTCQRRAPEQPRGSRIRDRGGPRPHRRTVLTRSDRPLWPGFRRPHGCFLPAEACHGTRSSDVSVTAPSPPGVTPVEPIRPRPLLPPLNVMSFGFHDPRHLRSIEELSSSPFPISDSAFRRTPVHDRCFARGGSEPPEARFRPRSQPQPEIAS